ncbi:MAG: hypothetical protein E7052_08400 [Lentisphaerae bacterium]|nr:hypothetical protein [Lentisphaerota bacterium]
MKKIMTLFLFSAFLGMAMADEFKHPGLSCTDKDKLSAALSAADNSWRRGSILILQKLADHRPADFEELCAVIDTTVADLDFGSESARKNILQTYKKQFALFNDNLSAFRKDAALFCIENPCSYDFYYYTHAKAKEFFSKEQRYAGLMHYLIDYNDYTPQQVLLAVTHLVEVGIELPDVDVKSDLIKLNRKFSLRLVRDKDAWTPVVQNIRTAMATF